MTNEATARQLPEYRAALADLRTAVEARRADPSARHLLDQIREARARVRSIERGERIGARRDPRLRVGAGWGTGPNLQRAKHTFWRNRNACGFTPVASS